MVNIPVGAITFEVQPDGALAIRQRWSPSVLSASDRSVMATALREIAENLDGNLFEVDGQATFFDIAPER